MIINDSISSNVKNLIEIMKKMTMNIENLINCVSMTTNSRDLTSKMTTTTFASVVSRAESANQSSFSSQNVASINICRKLDCARSSHDHSSQTSKVSFADRSFSNKCFYCFNYKHFFKRHCSNFNNDFRSDRKHMQDEKIHLRSYSLEIMSCRMIKKRS